MHSPRQPAEVAIATPSARRSTHGNRITALRWAALLRASGLRPWIVGEGRARRCDILIALHAWRSAPVIEAFRAREPDLPVATILTGTDLYGEFAREERTLKALHASNLLVVLQSEAIAALPADLRHKARLVRQSARASVPRPEPAHGSFEVALVGHLRDIKRPLDAAYAARLLPRSSRIRILHAGGAPEARWQEAARAEERTNERYRWLGSLKHGDTLRLIARARVFVLTSEAEGGSNALLEAIAAGTPILATRIAGVLGTLPSDHPGLFDVGDVDELARLLARTENDADFLGELARRSRELLPLASPERECLAVAAVVDELLAQRAARAPGS